MARVVFLLIDGFADPPNKNTPLRRANKLFLESLRDKIYLGQILPLEKDYRPKEGSSSVTGLANLGLLGYKIKPDRLRRGPLEAVGSDLNFTPKKELALRVDFATVDENLTVIDRRAGRNTWGLDELSKEINKHLFSYPFHFHRTYGHRGVLIFKSKLSPYISDSDPFKTKKKVKKVKPLRNDRLSKLTAQVLNQFLEEIHFLLKNHPINDQRKKRGLLPANYLLTREAGNNLPKLKNFFKRLGLKGGLVIAENGVVKGGCKLAGFKALTLPEIEDLEKRYLFYLKALKENKEKFDLIYLHFKEADEASHDKDPERKRKFFEFFDKWLKKIFDPKIIFVITGDHLTDSKTGKHLFGPLHLIIINHPKLKNNPQEISELEAQKSKIIKPPGLWKLLF